MVLIFIRQSFNTYNARFTSIVLTSWQWNVWQVELWYSDHKRYPCNDFVWKNNQWESCRRTLELRPIALKILKRDVVNPEPCIGGLNHWLNPKITISPSPSGLVALRTLLVQFLLLHCVIAASILFQSFVLLYGTVRDSIVCCWWSYGC